MFSFNCEENKVVKEPFASQLREKLFRYRKGEFTEEEIKSFEKQKEKFKKYKAIWK